MPSMLDSDPKTPLKKKNTMNIKKEIPEANSKLRKNSMIISNNN